MWLYTELVSPIKPVKLWIVWYKIITQNKSENSLRESYNEGDYIFQTVP